MLNATIEFSTHPETTEIVIPAHVGQKREAR
jgi:hypothetical protein